MYVDRIMNSKVITITEDAKVSHLFVTMREQRVRHLPVVRDGNTLVGLVTFHDLQRISPSSITTLTVGEVNYLLDRLTAEKVMQTRLITCSPDTLVEEAGYLMRKENIGCLPVVKDGKLVGILTGEDLLDFFLEITGCRAADTARIAVHLPDEAGQLVKLLTEINAWGGYIATVISPVHPDTTGRRIVIVRYRASNPGELDKHLKDLGYELITENLPAASQARPAC